MPKSKFKPLILEKLEEGPASLGTLQEICGKESNIRKALYGLLREGIIEINGYDEGCKTFKTSCMMFRKVDGNIKNPIYVQGLLDNPLKDDNYFKIQQLFSNRINEVNQTYREELEHLKDIQGRISLKEAIESHYLNPDQVHHRKRRVDHELVDVTYKDMLREHPEAEVYYLKREFITTLAPLLMDSNVNYPYFGKGHKRLLYDRNFDNIMLLKDRGFVKQYKSYLHHLPITKFQEEILFRHFVINSLRKKDKTGKKDIIWDLALTFTNKDLSLFVEKLRVIEYIAEFDDYLDNFEAVLRF
jgi:hypothetical protein